MEWMSSLMVDPHFIVMAARLMLLLVVVALKIEKSIVISMVHGVKGHGEVQITSILEAIFKKALTS